MARIESYRRWTQEEVDFLRENYDEMTAGAIADALNRTPESVWEKATKEKLRKHHKSQARSEDGPWFCPACRKTKPKKEFNEASDRRGSAYCTQCTNAKVAERRTRD